MGLLVAGVAFLMLGIGRAPAAYDEGLILAGADRLLLGDIPYRDFWNTHPPAQIWLVAGLFRLFGESMMVLRVYDVVVKAGLAVAVWAWTARLGPRWVAVAAFAVAVLWLDYYPIFGHTVFPALLLGLGSLALLVRGLESGRPTRWPVFAAGLLAGLGGLFRADFGAYGTAAAASLIALASALGGRGPWGARLRQATGGVAVLAAGAALPVGAALLCLRAQGVGLSRFLAIVVTYPLTTFPEVRGLPIPALSAATLPFHAPILVGVAGLVCGALLMRRDRSADRGALAWCALSLLLLLSSPHARTRADLVHQVPTLLLSVALAGGLWTRLWRRRPASRVVACALLGVLALAYLAVPVSIRLRQQAVTATAAHGLPRGGGVALEPDQVATVRSVQALIGPREYLFVGAGRHDRVWANDALFYFLAGRRYATAYHNLLPGLVTREDVQQDIVSELRVRGPGCVVLCTKYDGPAEPNGSRRAGSRVLDDYIRRAYVLSGTTAGYQIWRRR